MGINVSAIQGSGPFWGLGRQYNREFFFYLKNIPLTNQCPECIDILYEALPWDKEIQVCANKVPGVINGSATRGHSFV